MRFKYYLRGCGLGILLAAIILTIGYHRNGTKKMSDLDIMQRASELGMIMPDDSEETDTEHLLNTQNPNTDETQSDKTEKEPDSQSADKPEPDKDKKPDKDKDKDTDADKTDSDKKDTQQTDDKKDSTKGTETANNDSQSEETKPENSQSAETDTGNDEPDDTKPEKVAFTIRRGEYCREIAENLYDQGLVDDAEAFREYMSRNNYDNNIQVGTFELSVGMDYKEIAKIITNKDNRI